MIRNKKVFVVFSVVLFILVFSEFSVGLNVSLDDSTKVNSEDDLKVIKIAQYPRETGSDSSFQSIFSYTWYRNNTTYRFEIDELSLDEMKGNGNNPLSIGNYDILVVGASFDSFTKHAFDRTLLDNIRNFVKSGGGYIGVCAGAFLASNGFGGNDKFYEPFFNNNILKIANVYVNCDLDEENQYIWKLSGDASSARQGMPPIEMKINRSSSNPIFKNYPKPVINITYGGGGSLYPANIDDPLYGDIDPILFVNEELMDTKPIHKWHKRLIGWAKGDVIKTDIYGEYGGVATSYGSGKVVIFPVHPEIRTWINGSIEEYVGKSTGFGIKTPMKVVYDYNGEPQNVSTNWWIHRRAAAWIAGVSEEDMPPSEEFLVLLTKPYNMGGYHLYVNNNYKNFRLDFINKIKNKILSRIGKTVIIGDLTVEGYCENCEYMEFYLDGELKHTDDVRPFSWDVNSTMNGAHKIKVKGYGDSGSYSIDNNDLLFY